MATIGHLINNLKAVNFNEVIEQAVEITAKDLSRKQQDQMLHGLNAEGDKIGKYKNPRYAEKKYAMNPLAGKGNVDLKLTGAFQKDIVVDAREISVVIDSADVKSAMLQKKYGKVFGLNKEYAGSYASQQMGPAATKIIISQIHKV